MEETVTVESPGYYVSMPTHMPDLVFNDYTQAFEHATGLTIDQSNEEWYSEVDEGETRISVWFFEEPVDFPVVDV